MKLKKELKVFIVKTYRGFISLKWYFHNKKQVINAFKDKSLTSIKPFKIHTWKNGAYYFLATKGHEKVFIKLHTNFKLIEREVKVLTILNKNPSRSLFPFLFHYSIEEDFAFLVTNFISGLSFGDFELTKKDQAVSISEQFLAIYNILKNEGLVHRDIRPDNIIITNPQRNNIKLKLIDFGQAVSTKNEYMRDPPIQFIDKNAALNIGEKYKYKTNVWDDAHSLYSILDEKLGFKEYKNYCQSNLNYLYKSIGNNIYEYKGI